jgi:hypothetical protein
MASQACHLLEAIMAATESQDRLAARLKIVDEHIARENQHDLEGILRTFGQRHAMMTSPGHYIGHDGVRTYYDGLLKAIPTCISRCSSATQARMLLSWKSSSLDTI